jgi:mannosyltransferase
MRWPVIIQAFQELPRRFHLVGSDSNNSPSPSTRRGDWLVLAVILAMSVGVRSYRLSDRSLWLDEAFTWRLIQFPWHEMMSRIALDNSPPLYYVVLKLWVACFGTTPLAMRSLSVLFGAVTVAAMYAFASVAIDRDVQARGADSNRTPGTVALLVALLVSLSVFQIRWSWEIRMYTMGTALAAMSSWLLFRALRSEHHRAGDWLLYGFVALLFAYTHYYALFSIAAQVLFVGGFLLHRARLRMSHLFHDPMLPFSALGIGVVVIGWLPWLPFFWRQKSQVELNYWTAPASWWNTVSSFYQMFVEPQDMPFPVFPVIAIAALCGLGMLSLLIRCRACDVYVFVAGVAPLALGLAVTLFGTHVFYYRYLMFAHLFMLAAVAILIHRLPASLRAGFTIAALAASVWTDLRFRQLLDVDHRPGARAAAAYLADHRNPDEPVVTVSAVFLPILYHSTNPAALYTFAEDGMVPHYLGAAVLDPEQILNAGELSRLHAGRAWVVNNVSGWGSTEIPVPPHWKLTSQHAIPDQFFSGIVVNSYEVVSGDR